MMIADSHGPSASRRKKKRFQTQASILFEVHDQNEQMRLYHRATIQAISSGRMQAILNTHSSRWPPMTSRSPSRSGLANSPLTASLSISLTTFSHQCFSMKFSRSKVLNWVGPRLLRRSAAFEKVLPYLCHYTTTFSSSRSNWVKPSCWRTRESLPNKNQSKSRVCVVYAVGH
jgi:hypothetical protein